jgi:hypothetical protein
MIVRHGGGEGAGRPLICINAPLRATTITLHRRSFAHADSEYRNRARVIVAVGFIVSAMGWLAKDDQALGARRQRAGACNCSQLCLVP